MTKEHKVGIDPGHGGNDPGAVNNGLIEKTMNLTTALATKRKLLTTYAGHFKVFLTREIDISLSLTERCNLLNKWGAEIGHSQHYNAGGGDGAEIFHTIHYGEGHRLALLMASHVAKLGQNLRGDRGTKTRRSTTNANRDYYTMIAGTDMPFTIIEPAFIDNALDRQFADTVEEQELIGYAIADAYAEYFGIPVVPGIPKVISTQPQAPTQPASEEMYRVRLTWANAQSQKGAFKGLENAKSCADSLKPAVYTVYNSKGEAVYTPAVPKPEPPKVTPTVPKTPIMGKETVTVEQCEQFLAKVNPNAPKLAAYYKRFGDLLGIKWGYAFAQMLKETGFLRFGGDVLASQNNYAGIGAVGNGAKGASFETPEVGVLAQMVHIYAYASKDPVPSHIPIASPRFHLVTRGIAPNWEDLNGRWAVPGNGYGQEIIAIYNKIASEVAPAPKAKTWQEAVTEAIDIRGISKGDKGAVVLAVQERLLKLGYSLPSGADGSFGSETEAVVKQFQLDKGIMATAIGTKTLEALFK